MTWFETLTGFAEESPGRVRANLRLDKTRLTSIVNGRTFGAGRFGTPSLAELRAGTPAYEPSPTRVREVVGDAGALHADPAHADAVFQVASQFNCLEMASPAATPEAGVGIYERDRTQGPACSIAAGAGTIVRNYFAEVDGRAGQTAGRQVDVLADLGRALGHASGGGGKTLWAMRNGYCLPTADGLAAIERRLAGCGAAETDRLRGLLRVGVQARTEVTRGTDGVNGGGDGGGPGHAVTQVFCSALPVGYSPLPRAAWDRFPRLVLDAAYEATFRAALRNRAGTGCGAVFLTLVGGGVFGNDPAWILAAVRRSLALFADAGLDVAVVSYGRPDPRAAALVAEYAG